MKHNNYNELPFFDYNNIYSYVSGGTKNGLYDLELIIDSSVHYLRFVYEQKINFDNTISGSFFVEDHNNKKRSIKKRPKIFFIKKDEGCRKIYDGFPLFFKSFNIDVNDKNFKDFTEALKIKSLWTNSDIDNFILNQDFYQNATKFFDGKMENISKIENISKLNNETLNPFVVLGELFNPSSLPSLEFKNGDIYQGPEPFSINMCQDKKATLFFVSMPFGGSLSLLSEKGFIKTLQVDEFKKGISEGKWTKVEKKPLIAQI